METRKKDGNKRRLEESKTWEVWREEEVYIASSAAQGSRHRVHWILTSVSIAAVAPVRGWYHWRLSY